MGIPPDLLLSCWIVEAARSAVLSSRGNADAAVRVAERSRILARACAAQGTRIRPDLVGGHASWMDEVAGPVEETGALGGFFLQRIGAYVVAHTALLLESPDHERLAALGAPDAEEVALAAARDGIPPPPPPEWPEAPEARAPGSVVARFGVIGDPHVGQELADRLLSVVVRDLNREGVNFSVALGDLTQDGRPELFGRAREILGGLAAPSLATLGNHDMWGGGEEAAGAEHFCAAFGVRPHGVHEMDGVRIILVDSADPAASPFPPFDLVAGRFTDQPNEAVPGGRISDEVAEWMEGLDAGAGLPTFIVLHHPPYPYLGFPPLVFGLDERSTGLLAGLAGRTRAQAIICGHTHRSALSELAGVPVLEVPSAREWPFGYGMVEVTDRGWSFRLRPISDAALVAEASERAGLLFRRYARGPDEARAFAAPLDPS